MAGNILKREAGLTAEGTARAAPAGGNMRKGFSRGRNAKFGDRLRRFAALLLALALLLFLDAQLRPVIKSMAAYQAKVYATRAINDSVYAELSNGKVAYNNLVHLSVNGDGAVSAIETDMVELNILTANLTSAASSRIAQLETQSIYIPVGTLLGNQWLSGRGPKVEFKIIPAGYVEAELTNNFDSAGINQTRHQIILNLKANLIAIVPGYTSQVEVNTSICLAETVIVGVSPDSFTEVTTGDGGKEMRNLIADYGASRSK
mgnify:FL=1